uniref:Uncharacterized protein n=1 Tax=Corethron hystrix TaxID=216773 RepID=A0A7S1FKL7_9STRA|mmetsp:Transcript_11897/g.26085  ORF Transcript_11897/g.26085 Transcript_11897/m.26085 type:complete len:304 (+) Transcript_11897:296-1207(+)
MASPNFRQQVILYSRSKCNKTFSQGSEQESIQTHQKIKPLGFRNRRLNSANRITGRENGRIVALKKEEIKDCTSTEYLGLSTPLNFLTSSQRGYEQEISAAANDTYNTPGLKTEGNRRSICFECEQFDSFSNKTHDNRLEISGTKCNKTPKYNKTRSSQGNSVRTYQQSNPQGLRNQHVNGTNRNEIKEKIGRIPGVSLKRKEIADFKSTYIMKFADASRFSSSPRECEQDVRVNASQVSTIPSTKMEVDGRILNLENLIRGSSRNQNHDNRLKMLQKKCEKLDLRRRRGVIVVQTVEQLWQS